MIWWSLCVKLWVTRNEAFCLDLCMNRSTLYVYWALLRETEKELLVYYGIMYTCMYGCRILCMFYMRDMSHHTCPYTCTMSFTSAAHMWLYCMLAHYAGMFFTGACFVTCLLGTSRLMCLAIFFNGDAKTVKLECLSLYSQFFTMPPNLFFSKDMKIQVTTTLHCMRRTDLHRWLNSSVWWELWELCSRREKMNDIVGEKEGWTSSYSGRVETKMDTLRQEGRKPKKLDRNWFQHLNILYLIFSMHRR